MEANDIATWMLAELRRDGCVYQDDVVDYVLRMRHEMLLRENADGNVVLGNEILAAFRKRTEETSVWVKPDRYWRPRVAEDEPGRDARG